MCTVVLLIRPGHAWPMLLAANRDEMLERAWDPPAAYWPEQPDIIAGRDRSGGGTWMGVNRPRRLRRRVLNRLQAAWGPAIGKPKPRGELPLLALTVRHGDRGGTEAIAASDASAWRSYNLVLADRFGAIFVRGLGQGRPEVQSLSPGLHMVTAHDPDDPDSPRVTRHFERFQTARPPEPGNRARNWQAILARTRCRRTGGADQRVVPRGGFGTVCSSLLMLPASGPPVWQFAPGAPDMAGFRPICTMTL